MTTGIKDRVLKGWTWIRVLYVVTGIAVIMQSYGIQSWIGMLFGLYFTAMGVFSFGCASGICYGSACDTSATNKDSSSGETVFEEVKQEPDGNKR